MTIKKLYEAARLRVRKSVSDGLDQDIKRIVDTAIADMKRIGVHDSWLSSPEDPMIVETILSYVKANYSIDTNAYPILSGIYDMNITKIKGDSKYFSAVPDLKSSRGGRGRMTECEITLIHPGEDPKDDEKTVVFAEMNPIGRDEFQSAGVNGYKARNQFVIWAEEYGEQPELQVGNKRLTIYRTYGVRPDGKIELYAAERVGNHGR